MSPRRRRGLKEQSGYPGTARAKALMWPCFCLGVSRKKKGGKSRRAKVKLDIGYCGGLTCGNEHGGHSDCLRRLSVASLNQNLVADFLYGA